MSNIVIYGGGTFSPVRNHLSLAAMSFGTTAKWLKNQLPQAKLRLTKMADSSSDIITNLDLIADVNTFLCDPRTSVIVMSAALCDYHGQIGDVQSGSHVERLQTRSCDGYKMYIKPSIKVIDHIKALRPDIKIIGFKTTTDEHPKGQVEKAKRMGVSVVLANDVVTRNNILVFDALTLFGDRAHMLASLVSSLQAPHIKFESDNEVWVQLDPNTYISRWDALGLSLEHLPLGNTYVFKNWHPQVEGLAIIEKVTEDA